MNTSTPVKVDLTDLQGSADIPSRIACDAVNCIMDFLHDLGKPISIDDAARIYGDIQTISAKHIDSLPTPVQVGPETGMLPDEVIQFNHDMYVVRESLDVECEVALGRCDSIDAAFRNNLARAEAAEAERDALKLRVGELEANQIPPGCVAICEQCRAEYGDSSTVASADSAFACDWAKSGDCPLRHSPKPTEGRGTSDAQRDPAIPAYMQDDDLDDR